MLPVDMKNFQFVIPDVLFGNGIIADLGNRIKAIGGGKVLIFTDKGLVNAGIVDKVVSMLTADGFDCRIFCAFILRCHRRLGAQLCVGDCKRKFFRRQP